MGAIYIIGAVLQTTMNTIYIFDRSLDPFATHFCASFPVPWESYVFHLDTTISLPVKMIVAIKIHICLGRQCRQSFSSGLPCAKYVHICKEDSFKEIRRRATAFVVLIKLNRCVDIFHGQIFIRHLPDMARTVWVGFNAGPVSCAAKFNVSKRDVCQVVVT